MAETRFKMLEVDLTSETSKVVDVTEDVRNYVGGRGLGAKLLWDRVPRGTDPLSPENILYFGIGPITGLMGSVVNVSAKSPLTLLRGQSNMNGHLGVEMAYAGYNAGILITGKAKRPVYLLVRDGDVQIRDASHLWGMKIMEAQYRLKEEIRKDLEDQNFRVAAIGPGGENLVRNASISHDFYHHAARLGMGTVMGSKNLKAIAVRGTKPPAWAEPVKLFQLVTKFFHETRDYKAGVRRWGHTTSMPQRYYSGTEGIKNKQLGWHDICDESNPVMLEQAHKVWGDGCTLCPAGCKVPYMIRRPPLGPCAGELRHDDAGGWNANVMIPGFEVQAYLTPFVDELGLDGEDVSGVVAWVMECYDRGIITKEDLGGIDLTWGNLEAICKLLLKIAYREGIGDILAEGLKFAPAKLGEKTKRYSMESKGVAITSYEPRGSMSDAIGLVTPPVGAIHGGRGEPERVMMDSTTTCIFLRNCLRQVYGSVAEWGVTMLNAACGWQLDTKDWADLTNRVALMERCYSIREGYLPGRDDTLPDRFFEETIYTKYGKPLVLDKAKFVEERATWYAAFGLTKNGTPRRETLERLGMSFVIPELADVLAQ